MSAVSAVMSLLLSDLSEKADLTSAFKATIEATLGAVTVEIPASASASNPSIWAQLI